MLRARIASLLEVEADYKLDIPPRPEFGDYSLNLAIALARKQSRNPIELANEIAAGLKERDQGELFSKIEVVKPGFINLFLNDSFLQKTILDIIKLDQNWGRSSVGQGKKVLLEFVSANPTGPLPKAATADRMLKKLRAELKPRF